MNLFKYIDRFQFIGSLAKKQFFMFIETFTKIIFLRFYKNLLINRLKEDDEIIEVIHNGQKLFGFLLFIFRISSTSLILK